MLRVEFTIEPFIEGQPGPHVLGAIEAVEKLGMVIEFGPFATAFMGEADVVSDAVSALISRAYAAGATHVSIHIEPVAAAK